MLRKRTTSLSSKSNMDGLNEIRSSHSHDHDHDHDHSSSSGLRSSGRGPRSTFRFVILIFFISTFVFLLYFQHHVPLSSSLSSSLVSLSTTPFIRIDRRIRNLMEENGNGHDNAHVYDHGPLRERKILKNLNNDENKQVQVSTAKAKRQTQTQTQTLFDDEPFIHIINTRFMQQQGNLTTLAEARLHLFETFTLPSLMEQSSQKFIWVIKVDPHLDKTILKKLVGMIIDADNIGDGSNSNDNDGNGNGNNKDNNNGFGERVFVVSSNANYINNYGSWRGGAEMREVLSHAKLDTETKTDITSSTSLSSTSILSRGGIHTGNIHLLRRIKELEASKIMLQTRLDADDGLHQKYLEHIQKDALERFAVPRVPIPATDTNTTPAAASIIHPSSSTKWFYWCSGIHVKWYLDGEGEHGQLHTEKNTHFCITPGLTLGFNVGTKIEEVPIYMHHKLYKNLAAAAATATAGVTSKDGNGMDLSCKSSQSRDGVNHNQGGGGQQCLMVITDFFGAIRARTSTSAGMNDVDPHAGKMDSTNGAGSGSGGAVTTDNIRSSEDQKRADILWKTVRNRFHVSMGRLSDTKAYFLQNSRQIAKDNLEGQCTKGHSCKKSSENKLKKLVREE